MNKEAKNCWEYWGCPDADKETCPVFLMGMGKECWVVVNTMSGFICNENSKKNSRNCWECPWFKKMSHFLKDGK